MVNETIDLDEARKRISIHSRAVEEIERVALLDAHGRFLAEDVRSDGPWPTTDRSAMDGFALATGGSGAAAGAVYPVVGEALAGHPLGAELATGQAVRIMTGAVVPPGADVVVRVEDTDGYDGNEVQITAATAPGANIRPLGSEVAAGTSLLNAGRRLFAAEIAALAVLGIDPVPVVRRPRVAILSTGDEVVDVRATPAPHQVRDSNSWALAAKVLECGGVPERLGIVPDTEAELRDALQRGLTADVLITIGGVSKGTHDLVHGTLQSLGVERVFHGVALKPGKPTFFGVRAAGGGAGDTGGSRCHVLGLPGNPASSFTTFDLFATPLLQQLSGGQVAGRSTVRAAGEPFRKNWRAQAIPARSRIGDGGVLEAALSRLRPSGDPFGLLDGDGFAIAPGDADPASANELEFVRYSAGHGGAAPQAQD